jgi:hypothetical protein
VSFSVEWTGLAGSVAVMSGFRSSPNLLIPASGDADGSWALGKGYERTR